MGHIRAWIFRHHNFDNSYQLMECTLSSVKWEKSTFVSCWPCISIRLCNKNRLNALFILSLFRQSTSTCFGHICSSASAGILYMHYSWYVLCFLVECLLAGLGCIEMQINKKIKFIQRLSYELKDLGFNLRKVQETLFPQNVETGSGGPSSLLFKR